MENYIIANATDKGQVREVNEDSMVTFDSPNGQVVAVCDGMGGMAAGDVASQLACAIIEDILTNNTFSTPEEAITKSIMAANQGILHRTAQDPSLTGMGSTCVMLIIKDGKVTYGWVGDSRIYYIANHTIRQISKDQSFVQALVDAGQITQEEAEHHPRKNEITNALGVQGMTPPVLGSSAITPSPGAVFLLCSDGLSGMVDNEHIKRIVCREELTLQQKANKLVMTANENGGLDNVTVQLVEFKEGVSTYSTSSKGNIKSGGETSKMKSILIGVASALVVLAIAAGAYFFFGLNKNDDPKPSKNNPPASGIKTTITNGGEKAAPETEPAKPQTTAPSQPDVKPSPAKPVKSVTINTDKNLEDAVKNSKKGTKEEENGPGFKIEKLDKKPNTADEINNAPKPKQNSPQELDNVVNKKNTEDLLKEKNGEGKD